MRLACKKLRKCGDLASTALSAGGKHIGALPFADAKGSLALGDRFPKLGSLTLYLDSPGLDAYRMPKDLLRLPRTLAACASLSALTIHGTVLSVPLTTLAKVLASLPALQQLDLCVRVSYDAAAAQLKTMGSGGASSGSTSTPMAIPGGGGGGGLPPIAHPGSVVERSLAGREGGLALSLGAMSAPSGLDLLAAYQGPSPTGGGYLAAAHAALAATAAASPGTSPSHATTTGFCGLSGAMGHPCQSLASLDNWGEEVDYDMDPNVSGRAGRRRRGGGCRLPEAGVLSMCFGPRSRRAPAGAAEHSAQCHANPTPARPTPSPVPAWPHRGASRRWRRRAAARSRTRRRPSGGCASAWSGTRRRAGPSRRRARGRPACWASSVSTARSWCRWPSAASV